jgi:F-type H+-transporting ATPase subunit b
MNSFVLLAAADPAGEGPFGQVVRTFGLNWTMFLSQVIAFSIVALVLKKFAYRPVLQMLEDRRQRIAEGLANAEKIKAELAKTEAAHQAVLVQAEGQAVKMIEEARAAAARVLEQETQKAIATANQIVTKAREASEAELARMKLELRREVGRLVVETTAKVTNKILTVEDRQRLAEETNRELAA